MIFLAENDNIGSCFPLLAFCGPLTSPASILSNPVSQEQQVLVMPIDEAVKASQCSLETSIEVSPFDVSPVPNILFGPIEIARRSDTGFLHCSFHSFFHLYLFS